MAIGVPDDVVRRQRRPADRGFLLLHAVGLLAAVALLGLTGPMQSRAERQVLSAWLTASAAPWQSLPGHGPSQAAVVGLVVVLLGCWLGLLALHWWHPPRPSISTAGVVLWCLPFALAAPIFSRDIYAYVAQGLLVDNGMDPYRESVSALVRHPQELAAVDPQWHHSLTPYGPLGLRVEQLAAVLGGEGQEWRSVAALRLLSFVAVAVTVWCVRGAVRPEVRPVATWLVLSPLVLIHLLSAAHLDALVCALVAAGLLALARRRPCLAVALITAGGAVKATAFVILPVVVVYIAREYGGRVLLRTSTSIGAALAAAACLFVTDPLGWVPALGTPESAWVPFTPSSMLGMLVAEVTSDLGGTIPAWTLTTCQLAVALAGVAAGAWILREVPHKDIVLRCALLVLVLAVTGPALWPWYLASGITLLVLCGSRTAWLLSVAVSSAGTFLALPLPQVPAQRVALAGEVATALLLLLVLRRSHSNPPVPTRRAPASVRRPPEVLTS